MTFEEFDKFQDELWKECIKMRDTKGKEYAHDADRFANFRRLSKKLEISDIKVAWVYVTKHLDSIESFIKTGKTYSTETIRGRFVDVMVYMSLMAGMVEEASQNQSISDISNYIKENACGRELV